MSSERRGSSPRLRRPRLTYIVTHPISARVLLNGQLAKMREWGFDVSVVSAPGRDLDVVREREQVNTVAVRMKRNVDLRGDLTALTRLAAALRSLRSDIVNAGTPKAGLLGMFAARGLGVPVRFYSLHGLRLETATGVQRAILGATERIAAACAHEVVCVSHSLKAAFIEGGFAPSRKLRVLGQGSANGLDTDRFAPTADLIERANAVRADLGIPLSAPVIGFIGRLSKDKGLADLLDAFQGVRRMAPQTRLMIVSADLSDEHTPPDLAERVSRTPNAIRVPFVEDVRPYLRAMDVLGFPSLREGLPTVVIEAASLEIPTVAYPVTGVVDAVVDRKTGTLVPLRDVSALCEALVQYVLNPVLRQTHGSAARERVVAEFAQARVWQLWAEAYSAKLAERCLPLPEAFR